MRKDILDEMGLTEKARNMTTWSEYTEIMDAVREKYSADGIYGYGITPMVGNFGSNSYIVNGDKFEDFWQWDEVGDKSGTLMLEDGKITFKMKDPRYQAHIAMLKDWYDRGITWPDAAYAQGTMTDDLMKQGVLFSMTAASELGIEQTKSMKTGRELICVKVHSGMIRTSAVQSWSLGIPVAAEEPEAAAYFINTLYTDPTVMNFMIRGVEGVDYEIVDGQAKYGEEPCFNQDDFVIGDNTLLLPVYGNGADFYDRVLEDIQNAAVSPYMGFVLDTASLSDYISQISVVNDQYNPAVSCGAYTEELFNEYVSKLELAGVQDYLDEIQKQLDAWVASR